MMYAVKLLVMPASCREALADCSVTLQPAICFKCKAYWYTNSLFKALRAKRPCAATSRASNSESSVAENNCFAESNDLLGDALGSLSLDEARQRLAAVRLKRLPVLALFELLLCNTESKKTSAGQYCPSIVIENGLHGSRLLNLYRPTSMWEICKLSWPTCRQLGLKTGQDWNLQLNLYWLKEPGRSTSSRSCSRQKRKPDRRIAGSCNLAIVDNVSRAPASRGVLLLPIRFCNFDCNLILGLLAKLFLCCTEPSFKSKASTAVYTV